MKNLIDSINAVAGETANLYDPFNYNPFEGSSWYYYVNSGDYKIEQHDDKIVIDVLTAGLEKEDIEAYIENGSLVVRSDKPGWNGKLDLSFYLESYKVSKDPTVKLRNGVLRFEFPIKNEKKTLEID